MVQRLTVVFASVVLTGLVLKQDVLESGNFSYSMFMVGDVLPAFVEALTAPGGYEGIKKRITEMFHSTPVSPYHKALRLEAYLGMVFGFMACIYASIVSTIELSLVITMIVSILSYFSLWFVAHTPSIGEHFTLFYRLTVCAALLYMEFGLDFGKLNTIFFLLTVNLMVGALSCQAAAVVIGLSSLYVYKLECDYVLSTETGSLWWLVGWGIMTSVLSYSWRFLLTSEYTEEQHKRIKGTYWQDNILGVFNIVVGGGLYRADYLTVGMGVAVVYLLPPVTLWFSLETKLLTHLWVGTPFHPSWWMYGSTREGQVPRYAKSDWVNLTFSIATALITIILTSYAWVTVQFATGWTAYRFESENTWKFAVAHGMLFIFHSGLWMIIASSGVPPLGKGAFWQKTPELRALFQCDPKTCVILHKEDLVLGHLFLGLGAFFLGDGSKIGTEGVVTKVTIAVAWIYTLVRKALIHTKRFEVPYYKEQEAMKAK